MYRKISAIVIPTVIAAGIIAYMLYSVWERSLDRNPAYHHRNIFSLA